MGSASMPPFAVSSFAGYFIGYTLPAKTEVLPSVYCATIESLPKAIHERRYIKRLKTTRIPPRLGDALPEECRTMLVVVEVVYALENGKLCSMLRKVSVESSCV